MNSDTIRNTVEQKIQEESTTNAYYDLLKSSMDDEQAHAYLDFTIQYLRNTPDMIDHVFRFVSHQENIEKYQPVFNALFSYWQNEYDFIPDHVGIAGVCDDAYLSMTLMQLVADSKVPSTNTPLFPGLTIDFQKQNEVMAHLLGPMLVTQLDATANQTYQSIQVQESLNIMFNTLGMNNLFSGSSEFNMMHSMLEQNRIQEQVNTDLGAMGIF